MYTCQGKFCVLEELSKKNEFKLHKLILENEIEYRTTISAEKVSSSFVCYQSDLERWFLCGRNYQFLVNNRDGQIIGTMFFYGWDQEAREAKCSCFFIPNTRSKIVVIEALCLFILFAQEILHLRQVNFDVYEDNIWMQRLATKIQAISLIKKPSFCDQGRLIISYFFTLDSTSNLVHRYLSFFNRCH